ncbi:MAG TPA: hypothetical protein VK578_14595 [Edaphobacter sp.]|nr:hypothetical protein [Edaphobacter sp.]
MFEFNVPEGLANLDTGGSDPAELLSLVIGIFGDEAARIADLEMEGELTVGRILPNEPFALRFAAASFMLSFRPATGSSWQLSCSC